MKALIAGQVVAAVVGLGGLVLLVECVRSAFRTRRRPGAPPRPVAPKHGAPLAPDELAVLRAHQRRIDARERQGVARG